MSNSPSQNVTPSLSNLWSRREIEQLLVLVANYGSNQWDKVALGLGNIKSEMECEEFYIFIMNCASILIERKAQPVDIQYFNPNDILKNQPSIFRDNRKKRYRRKASQIDRLYKCQESHCNRSYGTEGALKMHIKIKHPSAKYDTKYQLQAKYVASLNKKIDDDEIEDDEDSEFSIEQDAPRTTPPHSNIESFIPSVPVIPPSFPRNYVPSNTSPVNIINIKNISTDTLQLVTPLPIRKPSTETSISMFKEKMKLKKALISCLSIL